MRDGIADRLWCHLPWGWQVHVKFSCMRSDERLHSYLNIRIKEEIWTLEWKHVTNYISVWNHFKATRCRAVCTSSGDRTILPWPRVSSLVAEFIANIRKPHCEMMIKPPNATQLAASSSPATTPAWHFQLQITSLVKSSLNDKGLICRTKIRAAKLPAPCCSLPLPVWGGFRSRVPAFEAPPWKVVSVGKTEFLLYRLFTWKEILSLNSLASVPGRLPPTPGTRRNACSGWYWVAGQETIPAWRLT